MNGAIAAVVREYLAGLALVTGVVEHPDGGVKVYLGQRARGVYIHVTDDAEAQRISNEWARSYSGHLCIPTPPDDALQIDGAVTPDERNEP